MKTIVPRTCTEAVGELRTTGLQLSALRRRSAYVLLGEPGAGKTTAFTEEAKAAGGELISARDFVALDRPGRRNRTLFIDGLDEMRATGSGDGQRQFDAIRSKLDALGRPPFRISCREADWLGASDHDDLRQVSPDGEVAVFHLESLTDEQITRLLAENHGIADPRKFVEQARERRLGGLLANPQSLGMLAEAVGQRWPDSLTETYAHACTGLAGEFSKRHRDARRGTNVPVDAVLEAAGQVCAMQLLAGIAGVATDADSADASHPSLEAIGIALSPAVHQALKSRLFESAGHEERRAPAHRSIAEFLGARYLAQRIDRGGLPLGRVVALLVGDDGGVVADLRGLHAWLAVHSLAARPGGIARDPLGVVLHGDPRSFPTQDRRNLLAALGREAQRYPWFRSQNWEASPFGALAGPDMVADFREILTAAPRDDAHESLLDCVLEAITHGEPLPELGDALTAVARDATHFQMNRLQAVDAYLNACASDPMPLQQLLDEINDGKIEDCDDELTGLLLQQLYPMHLSARNVIDYLHPSKQRHRIGGRYQRFWEARVVANTAPDNFPEFLDSFAARKLKVASDQFHIRRFAGELLATGLETVGNTAPVDRLSNWLGIGLDERFHCYLDKKHESRVADWLGSRPTTYLAILEYSLTQVEGDGLRFFWHLQRRLHGAEMPREAEDWCFANATTIANDSLMAGLFNKGAISLARRLDYTPALLDAMISVAARYPSLQTHVDRWLQSEWEEWRQDDAQENAEHAENERRRISESVDDFRKKHALVEAGTSPSGVMHHLAMIYFGRYREARGDTPIDRLQTFFGNDAGITLTALAGLRRCLSRPDLPTVREIIDLETQGRHHLIAEACLAGAEELARDGEPAILSLDGEVQARLVAFRLTHDFDDTPTWFLALVRHCPQLVADVLSAYGSALFKARKEHVSGLYPLAHDDAYAEVARHAAMPLLATYPLRWKKEKLIDLGILLAAAAKHANRGELLGLIESKLARSSLDGAQRSQWLAAGLLLDPARYDARLVRYVGKSPSHALLVAGFFESRPTRVQDLPDLSDAASRLLVRLLAPHLSPERPTGAHWVSPEIEAADLVRALISRLGANPATNIAGYFDELIAIDSLRPWHKLLRHYKESQRIARREAQFRRASVAEVVRTLANAGPANAADLQALLVQHLRDIAQNDRDGNTTGYERYWVAGKPHHENYCRDRLLELLREKLRPTGVDAQPECEYRENTRADIRASFGGGGFNVPIEIKRDSHRDLWKALREQLIAQYVRDPGAAGFGIYLVFWFGGKDMPVAGDGGRRPDNAGELERRLRETLLPDERRSIEIVVLDCARPAA